MHEPQVLILDEPTSGLDPLMQHRFLDLVQEEKQRGATILMSSHIFPEIERVCDRVGILRDGTLVAVEDIRNLRANRRQVFTVLFAAESEANRFIALGGLLQRRGTEVEVEVRGDCNEFIGRLAQCRVHELRVHELGLEELFMHYYEA